MQRSKKSRPFSTENVSSSNLPSLFRASCFAARTKIQLRCATAIEKNNLRLACAETRLPDTTHRLISQSAGATVLWWYNELNHFVAVTCVHSR